MGNKKKDKIEWLGMDGLLVLSYFVLVVIIFCSFKFKIDFLTAWVFPLVLLAIVLTVTINYAKTLGGFIRMQNQKIREGRKNEQGHLRIKTENAKKRSLENCRKKG